MIFVRHLVFANTAYTTFTSKHMLPYTKRNELRGALQPSHACNACQNSTFHPSAAAAVAASHSAQPQWNPNPDHHILAVGAGRSVVLIATGTGGEDATAITEALLQAASSGPTAKAAAPKNGKNAGEKAEVSDQSESESKDEDEGDEGDDMAGAGKKAPPVKWEALVSAVKGKGRRRRVAAAAVDDVEGEVGPRVVLR